MSSDLPPRSKEKSTFVTPTDVQREIKQELPDNDLRNGHRKDIEERIALHGAVDVQTGCNPFEETSRVEKKKVKGSQDKAAEVDVVTIRSESPPRVAVVQPRIEAVPGSETDGSLDKRVEETIMTMKLELAKIDSDMVRTRSAMRETKSDMARMQANIALLETISETRNAENRRLKQENDQQASKIKMLMEELAALRARMRTD